MLKKLKDNKWFVVIVILMVLFMALFMNQCRKTKKAKAELLSATHIAQQNIAALHDSSIQLKVTKEQLKNIDSHLYVALNKIDSIGKVKSSRSQLLSQYIPLALLLRLLNWNVMPTNIRWVLALKALIRYVPLKVFPGSS